MEEKLINKLLELEKEIDSTLTQKSLTSNNAELMKFQTIELTQKEKLRRLSEELKLVLPKDISDRILNKLIARFHEINNRVKEIEEDGLLILNNFNRPRSESITNKIQIEVDKIIKLNFEPLIGPIYNLTRNSKIGIRKENLVKALENEIKILSSFDEVDYFKIRDYYLELVDRLKVREQQNYEC